MRGARIMLVAALMAFVSVAVLREMDRTGTAFSEVPEEYGTFARDGIEFRHPRGWTVSPAREGFTAVRASDVPGSTSARIEVRRWGSGGEALDQANRHAARLVHGERVGGSAQYEIDVPGSDDSYADDVVTERRGLRYRVTVVRAWRDGLLTTIAVRGRVTDDRRDPLHIAGTLRLSGP